MPAARRTRSYEVAAGVRRSASGGTSAVVTGGATARSRVAVTVTGARTVTLVLSRRCAGIESWAPASAGAADSASASAHAAGRAIFDGAMTIDSPCGRALRSDQSDVSNVANDGGQAARTGGAVA